MRKLKYYFSYAIMILKGHFLFKKREAYIKNLLYSNKKSNQKIDSGFNIIMIFNGVIPHGGIADRLKSILCVYAIAKHSNLKFGIHHVLPFNLEDYLKPKLNWDINKNELSFDLTYSKPLLISEISYSKFKKIIIRADKQLHIYATAYFQKVFKEYGYSKSQLFYELFEPSDELAREITHYQNLKKEWISFHFRFLNLLGDFEERELNNVLSLIDQEILINQCLKFVESKKDECENIFICSDSVKFLDSAEKLTNVFTIKGDIVHVDNSNLIKEDSYKKTFLDFFMLGKSKKIYSVFTKQMYSSYFPVLSAELNDVPIERIQI